MIFYPDWLMHLEVIARSIFYIGVGFGLFTHFTLKWFEFIWQPKV